MSDAARLPDDLPVPVDDGAADQVPGAAVPHDAFASTAGEPVDLGAPVRGRTVVFCFPGMRMPGEPASAGWDDVPGARGCTPEACGFRDNLDRLREVGAVAVYGLSVQPADDLRVLAERHGLAYPLLSDPELRLADALGLPTFTFEGKRLYKRLTLVLDAATVEKVFYPVFPPDTHAADVAGWLRATAR
ncbi:MAG: peroxiredoxin [Nocardioidaceae bacterium]